MIFPVWVNLWFNGGVRSGENIPKGEKKRKPFVCLPHARLPLPNNNHGNNTICTDQVQEDHHPSLRKGNGMMLCRGCLEPVEYAFSRNRGRRYTAEDGPAAETTNVAVGRCPKDGRYSTIYPDDMVRNDPDQVCRSKNHHPTIIDKACFDRVQEMRQLRTNVEVDEKGNKVRKNTHYSMKHPLDMMGEPNLKKLEPACLLQLFILSFPRICMINSIL
jgi:hypothetical protein